MISKSMDTRAYNWDFLRESGLVLLWEPFMIDAGISYPAKIRSISRILRDPSFLSGCSLAGVKTGRYDDFEWKGEAVEEQSSNGWFFYNFLERTAWRVISLGNFCHAKPSDLDDVCSILLEKIADGVGSFRPVSSTSPLKSWGFEAYLQNHAVKKSIKPALKLLTGGDGRNKTSFVSIDGKELGWECGNLASLESQYPELFSDTTFDQRLYSFSEKDCRNIVFRSVREALVGHPGAQAYYHHVVKGETIRQTCDELGLTKSSCHRLVQDACGAVWGKFQEHLSRQGDQVPP
jgi:hypothetical protein